MGSIWFLFGFDLAPMCVLFLVSTWVLVGFYVGFYVGFIRFFSLEGIWVLVVGYLGFLFGFDLSFSWIRF